MDENELFLAVAAARENKRKQRLKGYYICPTCGEFMKFIPTVAAKCPFCDMSVPRILYVDSVQEQVTIAIWKNAGCYSELRCALN